MTSNVAQIMMFFLSATVALGQDVGIDLPYDKPESELSTKEKVITWLHTRHSPGHFHDEEHDVPAFLQFKPTLVSLPHAYKLPLDFVVIKDQLDLRALTPQMLERLSASQLKHLLSYLATVNVEIQYSNAKGHIQSGKKHAVRKSRSWEKSNAAAALALTMAVQSQHQLFIAMTSLVPGVVIPSIRGKMFGIVNPSVMAHLIKAMLLQLDGDDVGLAKPIARDIGSLVGRGLVYWVGKNFLLFNDYMMTVLAEATPAIEQGDEIARKQRHGILIGSVIAGIMNHVATIKKIDDKRIWVMGLISNLAWAATTFIGCAPFSAPVIAGVAGTISVGCVLSTAIMTALDFPRDYAPSVKEIEGSLEMSFLEASRKNDLEDKVNLLLMFKWMQAAIHSNGLGD